MDKESLIPYLITKNSTLLEAAHSIHFNQARTALIVDNMETRKLLGVMSQGDVLKSILQGVDVHSQVSPYMNCSFYYIQDFDDNLAEKKFAEFGYGLIPVVNEQMVLVGVYTMVQSFRNLLP